VQLLYNNKCVMLLVNISTCLLLTYTVLQWHLQEKAFGPCSPAQGDKMPNLLLYAHMLDYTRINCTNITLKRILQVLNRKVCTGVISILFTYWFSALLPDATRGSSCIPVWTRDGTGRDFHDPTRPVDRQN